MICISASSNETMHDQMKPKFGMYDLHKLQGQFTGLQVLILALKILNGLLSFTSFEIISQILGAKCVIVFKPYFVVRGILETSEFLLRRLYFVSWRSLIL